MQWAAAAAAAGGESEGDGVGGDGESQDSNALLRAVAALGKSQRRVAAAAGFDEASAGPARAGRALPQARL